MIPRTQYSKGTLKTLKDFYKDYLKRNPAGSPKYLTSKQYRDILELYFQLSMHLLISAGEPIHLYNAGEIYIKKYKPIYDNQKSIDWKRTKDTGEVCYHVNNHSNGYYSRIKWNKHKVYLKNKHVFKFTACRWAMRMLKTYIIEHNSIIKYYG